MSQTSYLCSTPHYYYTIKNMIVQPRISGYVSPYRASPKLFTLFCKRYKIKNRLGGSIPLIHGCQVKNPESLSLSFVSRFTTFFMTCGSSYPIAQRFLEFTVGSAFLLPIFYSGDSYSLFNVLTSIIIRKC